jgi:hypothetical protein
MIVKNPILSIDKIIILTILLYVFYYLIPYFDWIVDFISKIKKIISNFMIGLTNFIAKISIRFYFGLYLLAVIIIWIGYFNENISNLNHKYLNLIKDTVNKNNNKFNTCVNPFLCKN